MQEAIQQVKKELGRDAVILHARKFKKGGAFGLFGREAVEVIAAVDTAPVVQQPRPEEARTSPEQVAAGQGVVYPVSTTVAAPPTGTGGGEKVAKISRPLPENLHVITPMSSRGVNSNEDSLVASLQTELATLRKMLEQVTFQLQSAQGLAVLAPAWEAIQRVLLEHEVAPEYITELESHIFKEVDQRRWQDEKAIQSYVRQFLARHLKTAKSSALTAQGKGQVIALVGPTGVGKTTTVAKLAAQYALFLKKKVGLITVDTYRIAAVEQLRTFAEIIGIPVEVAFTPPEMKLALAKLADKDVVLIDTAGRSQKNETQLAELKAFLGVAEPDEIHLVLSATTKAKDLKDCLSRFQEAGFTHLIFTKLDETSSYGGIFNSIRASNRPVTYITTGQNVPEDIEEATSEKLADLLLKGV